jgi:hypothetical protein
VFGDGKHVKTSGPMFDGRAERALNEFIRDFAEGYAEDVNNELQNRFRQNFKTSTGRYEAQVRTRRLGRGVSGVTSNSPYGAWLEGASARNRKSSFKGYRSFGLTAVKMERRAGAVANAEFRARYLRRMN